MPDNTDFQGLLASGASPAYIARLFAIESGGNPNAVTGSNRGLGQFGPQEEARYGITDRTDPNQQSAAVTREAQEHGRILSKALGRDPTPGELYLTHQQGMAGGPALLTAPPDTPAWQAIRKYYGSDRVAKSAITGNLPRTSPLAGRDPNDISAGDFAKFWVSKFEGGLGPSTTASQAAPGILNDAAPAAPPVSTAPTAPNPSSAMSDQNVQALLKQAAQYMQPSAAPPPLSPINIPIPQGLDRARLLAAMRGPVGAS